MLAMNVMDVTHFCYFDKFITQYKYNFKAIEYAFYIVLEYIYEYTYGI